MFLRGSAEKAAFSGWFFVVRTWGNAGQMEVVCCYFSGPERYAISLEDFSEYCWRLRIKAALVLPIAVVMLVHGMLHRIGGVLGGAWVVANREESGSLPGL